MNENGVATAVPPPLLEFLSIEVAGKGCASGLNADENIPLLKPELKFWGVKEYPKLLGPFCELTVEKAPKGLK